MRHYLRHPANARDYLRLPFGQRTVFKSVAGNDYFLLSLVGTGRALTPYDPATDTTFGNAIAVPTIGTASRSRIRSTAGCGTTFLIYAARVTRLRPAWSTT